MTDPLNPKQVDRLIADYLAGSLSDADRPVFEDWLRASPKHPQLVARLSITDFCIRELCQDTKSDYLLDILNQIDQASGPAQIVTLHHLESPWQRYRIHAAWGAIAAALLLAAALWAILQTGPQPQTLTNNTLDPNKPAASTESTPRGSTTATTPVATLTATHNAQWGRPASAGPEHPPKTGSNLHPNQRLTLTAGFAEITTARGAKAILQAPATIELTNNDNAIRLHAGKLVGICETPSSKGFLVRTPHMDITDLGTRFGVDASRSGTTEVHVIEGIIEVGHASTSDTSTATPQRLLAGQALQAKGDADGFVAIQTDPARFAAIMPTRIELRGTGQGLALKETDPNWRVTAIDGKPLETPGTMMVRTAHDGYEGPPFLPNDPATSQWLIIDKRLGQSGTGPVTFTCQSRFEIPPGVDASAARLIVSFDADDSVTAVRINGNKVPVPHNEFVDDSRDLHVMTIHRHLVTGQNTIEFDVMDRRTLGRATSGLRVKLALQPDEWRTQR